MNDRNTEAFREAIRDIQERMAKQDMLIADLQAQLQAMLVRQMMLESRLALAQARMAGHGPTVSGGS